MEATHSRLIYYIRGDKEFQGESERVYGVNWTETGSKLASNPHIREGRDPLDLEKNDWKVNSNSKEEAGNYTSHLKALKNNSDDWFEIKVVERKLVLCFVIKVIFVAILTIVALVLSLCHSSHQCYPPSQVSSSSPLSHLGIEGSVFKAKPEYSTPRSVKIHWVNVVEGGAPNGFNMITESNDINETNFKISVNKIHMTFFKIFQILMSVL